MSSELITANEAAKILNVTPNRVRAMITAGRLPASKLGDMYVIKKADLNLVKNRTPGRPPKAETKGKTAKPKKARQRA